MCVSNYAIFEQKSIQPFYKNKVLKFQMKYVKFTNRIELQANFN